MFKYVNVLRRLAEAAGSMCSTQCGRLFPSSRQRSVAHSVSQISVVRTMLCRSRYWFAGQLPVRRMLAACFAVLLSTVSLSAADEETNWTVLTVGATVSGELPRQERKANDIAGALLRCQAMTADESDCGAEFVAFRTGLALALMCGDYRVIVTASDSRKLTALPSIGFSL